MARHLAAIKIALPGKHALKVVQYAFKNESGVKQFYNEGRLKNVALCGTDFDNSDGAAFVTEDGKLSVQGRSRSLFDEVNTNPRRGYIYSRGWGCSQLTAPLCELSGSYYVLDSHGSYIRDAAGNVSDPIDELKVVSDKHELTRDAPRGLPIINHSNGEDFIPAYIASLKTNLQGGVVVFASAFMSTPVRRPCTYTPKYDCDNCLSRFREADMSFGETLVKGKGGQPDRKRRTYSISSEARQQIRNDMLSANPSTPAESLPPLEDGFEAGKEWPCSWPLARLYYGGESPEGDQHVRQCIKFARSNTHNPEPPKASAKKGSK